MPLAAGVRLGPYEILGPLGAGGMGEVYRARDTRLERTVAVKVLPSHLASAPELRARFEREARAVSSLNHPHICVLHDVGSQDGVDFLVMEHLEGETLAHRLERGPLPTAEVLRYGIEIADALDRAHRSHIVHRDLKPGNIMLTKSGAKLMDFGLARGTGPSEAPSDLTSTPTVTRALTAEGTLVGTFQYMAPEQLEGKEADARTDLFALGAVLYEMATGRGAFEGKSQASLISSIMSSEPPPIAGAAPMSPPALDRVVRACLAKDPDERLQTAHDVKLQLQWIQEAGSQAGVPVPLAARRRSRERLAWILAAAAALSALALGLPRLTQRPAEARLARFSVVSPGNVTLSTNPTDAVISPDGRRLAFLAADSSGTTRVWIRPLESLTAQPLEGTDNAAFPFWSPDSRTIGFFADSKLKKLPAAGGSPEALCDAPDGRGGTWGSQGVIVFAPVAAGGLSKVSADGGEAEEIVKPDSSKHETGLRWPEFLPDGKHFLFVSLPSRQGSFDIQVGSTDSKQRRRLLSSSAAPVYAEPGYLLLVRNGRLMAQRFDARGLKLVAAPIPLGDAPPPSFSRGGRAVSVSSTGILAHSAVGLPNTQLIWLDRSGKPQGTVPLPPGRWEGMSLSPDGSRLVVERRGSASEVDLWMVQLSRGVATRFTFTPSTIPMNPIWSPDGAWIAFNSDRSGTVDIYRKSASGASDEELLHESRTLFKNLIQWSPDGRYIVFNEPDPTTGWDVWLLPVEGERKPVPYLRSRFTDNGGWISPDGHWLAYASDESGKLEVYVQSFPTPANKYQVSTSGGFAGIWSKDGKNLALAGLDGNIYSAPVRMAPTLEVGSARLLFKLRQDAVGFTTTPNFDRFLLAVPVGQAEPSSITLELNWTAGLKQK